MHDNKNCFRSISGLPWGSANTSSEDKYLALGKFKKGDKVILRYYFSKQNNWNYDAGVEKIGIENRSQKPPARKKG